MGLRGVLKQQCPSPVALQETSCENGVHLWSLRRPRPGSGFSLGPREGQSCAWVFLLKAHDWGRPQFPKRCPPPSSRRHPQPSPPPGWTPKHRMQVPRLARVPADFWLSLMCAQASEGHPSPELIKIGPSLEPRVTMLCLG